MSDETLGAALRTALIGEARITDRLGLYAGEPSVHTRRPVPPEAGYPMMVVSGEVGVMDKDGLRSRRPIVVRDIIAYGQQPADYRDVEALAWAARRLFHRNRWAVSVDGYHVIDIEVAGPFVAPTDDDKTVARGVTLTIKLEDLAI